ncbi:hypothetical protein LB507_008576 [Fusarium sp. FIESC RH6]|nr:hypothetical protein LB507_008576 [Fusarium sp. FIESC RH6]
MVPSLIPVVIASIGTLFTGICAWFSQESRDLAQEALEETKAQATAGLDKNVCDLTYSTALGGNEFYGYSYEARGDHLDCTDLPERKVIEKRVESYAKARDRRGLPYDCRETTMGEGYWEIRISNDTELHPFANITC